MRLLQFLFRNGNHIVHLFYLFFLLLQTHPGVLTSRREGRQGSHCQIKNRNECSELWRTVWGVCVVIDSQSYLLCADSKHFCSSRSLKVERFWTEARMYTQFETWVAQTHWLNFNVTFFGGPSSKIAKWSEPDEQTCRNKHYGDCLQTFFLIFAFLSLCLFSVTILWGNPDAFSLCLGVLFPCQAWEMIAFVINKTICHTSSIPDTSALTGGHHREVFGL